IVQGPLQLRFTRRNGWLPVPRIENSAITGAQPATMERLRQWRESNIIVQGRPEWVFIKLHCHGMDPRDEAAMLGEPMRNFLREYLRGGRDEGYQVHFVTAREMVNVMLAACDGREGNPSEFRDYRFRMGEARMEAGPEPRQPGRAHEGEYAVKTG
ncbi:MAG: hypothetical protein ACRD4K_13495, partial [Candidatus Acidiferrales bacterium]